MIQPFVNRLPSMPANIKLVVCTPEIFLSMMKDPKQCFRPTAPLPADAEIMRSYYSSETDMFYMVVKSESFSTINHAEQIPYLELVMHTGPCMYGVGRASQEQVIDPLAHVVNLAISWTQAAMSGGAPAVIDIDFMEVGEQVLAILAANADRIRTVPGMGIRIATK